jgi:hypothetical protein
MADINSNIFFMLFFIETIWDLFLKKDTISCIINKKGLDRFRILLLIILHHFLSTFLTFGWIINNKTIIKVYLATLFIVIGSWQINNGLCYFTALQNDMCGCNRKKPFNHLLQLMKIKENQSNKKYYYGILTVGILVSLYKLSK